MSNVQNVAKELQYLLLAAISLSAENNAKHEEDIQDKEMPWKPMENRALQKNTNE